MIINIGICGSFLIMLFIISFVFFIKEKNQNLENDCFKILVLLTILGLILEIIFYVRIIYLKPTVDLTYKILTLALYIYYIWWMYFFVKYAFISFFSIKDSNNTSYLKAVKILIVIYLLFTIITLFLPFDIILNEYYYYPVGINTIAQYLIGFFGFLLIIIFAIINNKNIFKKEAIPFIVCLILGFLSVIIQYYNHEFLILIPIHAIAVILMYFTIENPDLKLLNEVKLAKDEAEKANRAKTDFLSSMSHEIRTPLNAIIAFSEEILREEDLKDAKNDAEQVINSSKILLETVGGILDISKIEAGSLEINKVEYNPRELFKSITDLINIKMKEKNLRFSMTLPVDLPQNLYGDRVNIQKIIMNLLTNAYKYTEEGEVKFNVSCINQKKNCTLILAVEDTGRGIKQENIEKLFTKFSRLDEDRNTTIEGTGLGLAITKKLVELMGGKITVQSVYGSGSKFTVFLSQKIMPNNASAETRKDSAKTKDPLNIVYKDFSNKTVLVTDDNDINLKVAIKLLEKYKLNIIESKSGIDTINKIKSGNKYDLLLLDIEMPKVSGIKVLETLKEINFNTPVVALTANATTGDREKYLNLGFNEYLAKPIDRIELDRILNLYLSNGNESVVPDVSSKEKTLEPTKNLKYLEANGADIKKAISILGDIDMYNETIEIVFNSTPDRLKRLEEYKNKKDLKSYSIEVHALKSDLKYIGFYELSEIPYSHEKESKNNNIAYVEENFDNLKETIIKVLRICKKYLGK